jgi:hypothetical protein
LIAPTALALSLFKVPWGGVVALGNHLTILPAAAKHFVPEDRAVVGRQIKRFKSSISSSCEIQPLIDKSTTIAKKNETQISPKFLYVAG